MVLDIIKMSFHLVSIISNQEVVIFFFNLSFELDKEQDHIDISVRVFLKWKYWYVGTHIKNLVCPIANSLVKMERTEAEINEITSQNKQGSEYVMNIFLGPWNQPNKKFKPIHKEKRLISAKNKLSKTSELLHDSSVSVWKHFKAQMCKCDNMWKASGESLR